MSNPEELVLQIIMLMEQAKNSMEALRAMKVDEQIDGRAMSIAVTHLETAQLWVANARR